MKHWREYTLGEIADEIETMQNCTVSKSLGILPNSEYIVAKNALRTLVAMSGQEN